MSSSSPGTLSGIEESGSGLDEPKGKPFVMVCSTFAFIHIYRNKEQSKESTRFEWLICSSTQKKP